MVQKIGNSETVLFIFFFLYNEILVTLGNHQQIKKDKRTCDYTRKSMAMLIFCMIIPWFLKVHGIFVKKKKHGCVEGYKFILKFQVSLFFSSFESKTIQSNNSIFSERSQNNEKYFIKVWDTPFYIARLLTVNNYLLRKWETWDI